MAPLRTAPDTREYATVVICHNRSNHAKSCRIVPYRNLWIMQTQRDGRSDAVVRFGPRWDQRFHDQFQCVKPQIDRIFSGARTQATKQPEPLRRILPRVAFHHA